MNCTFQVRGLLRSCLVSLILTPFVFTKWLTQIFIDWSRFNKGGINEVRIEYRNKRRAENTKTKLNETTLITL